MISDKVRGWLAENHKNQQWLADELGMHRSTLSERMNDPTQRRWKPAEIHYLAEILGVTPEQLKQNSQHNDSADP